MESSERVVIEHPEGSIIAIRVHPSSSRRAVEGLPGNPVNIWVHSPPEKGKANKEALKALSGVLSIPASRLEITRGHSSRSKTVLARGLSPEETSRRLGLHRGNHSS